MSTAALSPLARAHALTLQKRATEARAEEALREEVDFGLTAQNLLASLDKKEAAQSVALALGERSDPVESFSAQRQEIAERLRRHEFAKAELTTIHKSLKSSADASAEAERKLVQQHLVTTEIEPATHEVANAFEVLRHSLVKLMAAHYVTYERHGNPNRWQDPDGEYGPAGRFIDEAHHVVKFSNSPYSIKPSWFPATIGRANSANMAGVSEAENAVMERLQEELAA